MQVSWTVTSQQETTGADANGRYGEGYRITFTTDAGQSGTIFVPDAQYNQETVRNLINAKVAAMQNVIGLSG